MQKLKTNVTHRPFILFGVSATFTALVIIALSSWLFYTTTVGLLTENLHQRLLAIATTAVAEFDPDDVSALRSEEDWQKPEWRRVVTLLKKIRENNPDIIFAYMFRKTTENPNEMEFVADSHSLNPYANTDEDTTNDVDPNGDGVIDDVDVLQWPGQPYPEPPAETFDAYNGPTTNKELYEDQWGKVLTGYAPLVNDKGEVVAVLAMDIRARDFTAITTQTLIPFILFSSLLGLIIVSLSLSIIRSGRSRIDLLQELDAQKDKVLHMVAHQFKGPVSAIEFETEMLLDGSFGDLNDEQKKNISAIRTASQTMGEQSAMVLAAAQITMGKKLPIVPVKLDLGDFFKGVVDAAIVQAKLRNVQLNISLPEHLPVVMLDRKFTQIAIDNLLSNAIKYTALKLPNGGGKVDFTVEIHGRVLHCVVRDTGIGIPEKDRGIIFKELARASNSGTEGTGLGLHVAMGAIESQGGAIHYESVENVGTTFFVELPLQSPVAN